MERPVFIALFFQQVVGLGKEFILRKRVSQRLGQCCLADEMAAGNRKSAASARVSGGADASWSVYGHEISSDLV
jgi:hypothetical protein